MTYFLPIDDQCECSPSEQHSTDFVGAHLPEEVAPSGRTQQTQPLTDAAREAAIQRAISRINIHEDGYRECLIQFERTNKRAYIKAASAHRVMSRYAANLAAQLIAGRKHDE
jgi:hypothetical protein